MIIESLRWPRLVAVLSFLIAGPAVAQITAHDGAPKLDPAKQFSSPMVLEVPGTHVRDLERKAIWSPPGIREYRCEDVQIAALRFKNTGGAKGAMELEVSGLVVVAESHDRYVTIRIELLDGETIVGRATRTKLDAEEKKGASFSFPLTLTAEAAERFRSSSSPILRLTMYVLKNGATPWTPMEAP